MGGTPCLRAFWSPEHFPYRGSSQLETLCTDRTDPIIREGIAKLVSFANEGLHLICAVTVIKKRGEVTTLVEPMFDPEGLGHVVVESKDSLTIGCFIGNPVRVFRVEAHAPHVVD